ncbi:MAG TPA: ATP-binding protein, partial [Ktedonobacteraceae bacterium]|nr:ATP-binding protein [Ktedonobacteraceae bacterium]
TQPSGLVSQDFLWGLLWLPALGVPYIWFAIGLYYAALINQKWRKRRPYLLIFGGALGTVVLALLLFNASSFTYADALRAIAYDNDANHYVSGLLSLPVLLSLLFLIYVTFCAIAPWFTASRIARLLRVLWHNLASKSLGKPASSSLRHALVDAFWDDPHDLESLEEPHLSWHLARPWLLLAALLMVGLTTSISVLIIQSIVGLLRQSASSGTTHTTPPNNIVLTESLFPLRLIILDLGAMVAVALVILLIGYSIVRHGILIERPLARRGFFEQWRGIVIVATALAIFIALLVTQIHNNLGSLLLITSLATVAYALFTWSSYTAHDRYIALLGPFVRSASLRHWLNTDLAKTERDLESLFVHLCYNVLAVQCAYLDVLTGPVRRSFSYRWSADAVPGAMVAAIKEKRRLEERNVRSEQDGSQIRELKRLEEAPSRLPVSVNGVPMICWILPIHDDRGLVATLYLGPREDGSAFTDEDMNLAQACGQRILDTLGDHEAMQAVAGLLRRRVVDVKLLGAQQRRILHDEILPQIHLALLGLEKLRSQPAEVETHTGEISDGEASHTREQVIEDTIDLISDTHRRLAAMMRATASGAPHHLEHDGMIAAIRAMLDQDFQHAFDEIEWLVSEETAAYIDEVTPPAIAELVFAAVQEALRNAARHARGADEHRLLRLLFKASWNATENCLEVIVADDGVGAGSAKSTTSGTGGGLLTHSALLAIAGGSLTVKSSPGEGVMVRILLPAESLR